MRAKPEINIFTNIEIKSNLIILVNQRSNAHKVFNKKLIFKQFFKKISAERRLFRYSLSIEEQITMSRLANQITAFAIVYYSYIE